MSTNRYHKVITPQIGESYHLVWANRGCVWKLISIDETDGTVKLRTPKTKKELTAKREDLRHVKRNENQNK